MDLEDRIQEDSQDDLVLPVLEESLLLNEISTDVTPLTRVEKITQWYQTGKNKVAYFRHKIYGNLASIASVPIITKVITEYLPNLNPDVQKPIVWIGQGLAYQAVFQPLCIFRQAKEKSVKEKGMYLLKNFGIDALYGGAAYISFHVLSRYFDTLITDDSLANLTAFACTGIPIAIFQTWSAGKFGLIKNEQKEIKAPEI